MAPGFRYKRWLTTIALLAWWVLAVGYGIRILLRYSSTPGRPARPPVNWPADAPVTKPAGRSSLLVFAHPACPCSRATIGELALIAAQAPERAALTVLFYMPSGDPMGWSKSDLMRSARAIPGAVVIPDMDGKIARRFGARTSGQTLLYDAAGRLIFNGGITAARGHSGDNDGRHAIVALLHDRTPPEHIAPVYGCALFSED